MSQGAHERGLLIGGRWSSPASGEVFNIADPATGEHVGTAGRAGEDDVDAAMEAAAAARHDWADLHPDDRSRILQSGADRVASDIDEIARILTLEQGKPLADSRKEIAFGVEVLRYYAEEGLRRAGSMRVSSRSDVRSIVEYAPVGPVVAIVPWNYPVDLYFWKVAPALAAGCPVVVKPPPEAPLAIGMVSARLVEAGLPPGVLSDLPGDGEIGKMLASDHRTAMVTATASTTTGQAIMRTAAERLTRVSLELGGQTPFVVLDDADVEVAAAGALRRSFSNMGQICISVNRILVDERLADPFTEALVEGTRQLTIGHGLDPQVAYGPVTTEAVRERSLAHVQDALGRGSRLCIGGDRLTGADFDRGTFFAPTVIDHVPPGAHVLRDETFGPVAAVHRVKSDADLLAACNNSDFGLAAYVYSEDLERAWSFASRLEVGAVGINVNDVTELQAPFGGWKLSGLGRELGREGLETYLESRHVRMRVRSRY